MNDANQPRCPRCGAALPARAPEGLCPRCLGALNLGPDTVLTGEELGSTLPLLSPAELAPHFPQLEILECLGRGGMGVVYKARQKSLDRMVALKLLAPGREQDPTFAERFAREAQALARLSHPSIVTVHDFGRAGDFYFLLMEFVDGVNLRQLLRSRKLTPEEALAIVPPLCDALQYAHERGIVHRDIKPENLLLDKTGRVKIADFGIAKMLGAGSGEATSADAAVHSTAAGTPQYMAPEQKSAPQQVDSRADIYSLGVVFYEMLTGELPDAKLQPPSRKVQVDVRLDEIVLRALEVKPEMRFATAAEFRAEIAALTHTPVVPPPPFQPGNRPWVRHWHTLSPLKRLMIRRCLYVFALLFTLNFVAPHLSVLGDGSTRVWTAGLFPHPWLAEMERTTSGGNHQGQLHVFFTRFTFISGFLAAAAWIALGGVLRVENGPGLLRLRGEPDAHGQRPVLVDRVVLAGLALLSITSLASTACLALFAAFTGDAPPLLPSLIFNLCPTLWVLALAILKGDSIRPPANPRLGKRAAWIMVFALACIAVGLIAASIHFMRVERQKLTPPRPVVVEVPMTRSPVPKGESIIRKDASVMLVHDDVEVHYVLFTRGSFSSGSRGSSNQKSLLWMDDGDIKLSNGRTFGYQRESVNPEFLRVNGEEFDLRKGRVIELKEDGEMKHLDAFPLLAVARDPLELAQLADRAHQLGHYIADLPGGVQVELLTVSSVSNSWWTPDGKPTSSRSYRDIIGSDLFRKSLVRNKEGKLRQFIWSLSKQTNSVGLQFVTCEGNQEEYGYSTEVYRGGDKVAGTYSAVASFSPDKKTTDVRLQIASGPWIVERALPPFQSDGTLTNQFEEEGVLWTFELKAEITEQGVHVSGYLPLSTRKWWTDIVPMGSNGQPISTYFPMPSPPAPVPPPPGTNLLPSIRTIPARTLKIMPPSVPVTPPTQPPIPAPPSGTIPSRPLHLPPGSQAPATTGNERPPALTQRTGAWFDRTYQCKSLAEISHLQFRARPYSWVEFKNVSLEAGRLTEVKASSHPYSRTNQLAGNPAFGSIRQLTLPYGSTLDFSSGAVGQMPGSLRAVDGVRVPEDRIYIWMKGTNADVAYPGDGNFYGMMLNMVTFKRDEWDTCTPQYLAERLHGESSDLRVRFDQNDPDKYTFGFKNGEGRLGLLQVTGLTKNPRGVQVRYKLVEASRNTTNNLPSENWLKMSYQEFDQSLGKHWRELADTRRFPEAARMIEQYLAVHPELEKGFQQVNGANLHFHAGQCWALAGENDAALKHLAVAHYSEKWAAVSDLHWNEYVTGTEAFLRGDRAALIQAHENLSHAPEANLPNLRVLDRLLADFNKSYAEAYEMNNQDHKKLSTECFNRTWELLEKKNRTPEENEQMISLAHASLAHWRQREDCQPRNLSIGYWQISRVYAVLGQAENATRYGSLCLDVSGAEPPFYVAYAHEALARAAKLKGDTAKLKSHLESARELAAKVTNAGERQQLLTDLDDLGR